MELSNDFEVLSELKLLLENRASNVKIVCLCTRVYCDDYQDYTKGTKGKRPTSIDNFTIYFLSCILFCSQIVS